MKMIYAALLAVTVIGCATTNNVPRPMKSNCTIGKERFIDNATAVLVSHGFDVKLANKDVGIIQAERINETQGGSSMMGITGDVGSISIQYSNDTMTVNAKTIFKFKDGSENAYTWDETNADGNAKNWLPPIMQGLRGLCSK